MSAQSQPYFSTPATVHVSGDAAAAFAISADEKDLILR